MHTQSTLTANTGIQRVALQGPPVRHQPLPVRVYMRWRMNGLFSDMTLHAVMTVRFSFSPVIRIHATLTLLMQSVYK